MTIESILAELIAEVAAIDIRLKCSNPACSTKTYKKGAWLSENRQFDCPGCGTAFDYDDESLKAVINQHLEKTRDAIKHIPGAPG